MGSQVMGIYGLKTRNFNKETEKFFHLKMNNHKTYKSYGEKVYSPNVLVKALIMPIPDHWLRSRS